MPQRPPKPIVQSFLADWNGRQYWAQSNGVSFNDFKQVVQYDWNRMTTTGYKMSDTEAFDSLSALATGKNPFKTPADTPPSIFSGPFGWFGAVENDIQGIATGLFHLPGAVITDVDQAMHGNFKGLAMFIPGVMDIMNLMSSSGRTWMTEHPVSDLLDLGGLGSDTLGIVGEMSEEDVAALAKAVPESAMSEMQKAGYQLTGDVKTVHGLGGMLYKLGAKDVAKWVSQFPSHPLTRAIRSMFGTVADNIVSVDRLRTVGTDSLGYIGKLPVQGEIILRPLAAFREAIANTPTPEVMMGDFHSIDFGQWPGGQSVLDAMFGKDNSNSIVSLVDANGYNDVKEMFTMGRYKGNPMSIRAMALDTNIPVNIRQAYISLVGMARDLQYVEVHHMGALVDVENPMTGELGKEQPGGPYQRFMAKFNRVLKNAKTTNGTLYDALRAELDTTRTLRADESRIAVPDQLKFATDKDPVTFPVALRRASDYFQQQRDQLFNHPAWGTSDAITADVRKAFNRYSRAIDDNFGTLGRTNVVARNLDNIADILVSKDRYDLFNKNIGASMRALRKLNIVHDDVYDYLNASLKDIKEQVRIGRNGHLDVTTSQGSAEAATKVLTKYRDKVEYQWNRYVERRFAPLVVEKMRNLMLKNLDDLHTAGETVEKDVADGKAVVLTEETFSKAYDDITHYYYGSPEVSAIFTSAMIASLKRDAFMAITDMKSAGYDPVFVQAIGATQERGILSPTVTGVDHYINRSIGHSFTDPLGGSVFDPRLGIVKECQDILRVGWTKAILEDVRKNLGYTADDVISEGELFVGRRGIQLESDFNRQALAENYARRMGLVKFDPNMLPELTGQRFIYNSGEPIWINRYNLDLLGRTFKSMSASARNAWDGAMNLYRVCVLNLSPRYFAHLSLGGTTMLLLRSDPISMMRNLGDAIKLARGDESVLPIYMSRGPAEADLYGHLSENPLDFHYFSGFNKLGRMMKDSGVAEFGNKVVGGLTKLRNIEESVVTVERSLAYLTGMRKADLSLMTDSDWAAVNRWNTTPEEWLGAKFANKVYADRMTQSPFDRAIIRMVLPFWGWTYHVLRYVTTFPFDHPLRASILQAVANEAMGENAELPGYLYRLMFLGSPNAQGNVEVLDLRQWNPFRDISNDLSLPGLMSGLNPVLSGLLAAKFNFDPITGGPDLYPSLTYDSFYGGSQATGGNWIEAIAEQFSPQFNTLMSLAQQNSSLRQEAQTNPGKLPYLIADSLGMPWIPYTLNVKQVRVKELMDDYKLVENAVNQALTTNSMAPLQGFSGLMPFDDYETNSNYIASMVHSALIENKAARTNIPAADMISLMYPYPYAPQYLEAATQTSGATGVMPIPQS